MRLATLTRSHEWWDHKTPQVLSLAYATAIIANAPLFSLLYPGFLMIFASLVAIAIYASIINDFTDLEIDRACGKSNMMEGLKPGMRLLLLLISLGLVLTAAAFIYPNIYGVVFYLLIAVSISLYSFEPVRFKKRGIWGIISCASAEHFFPVLFSIAVITWYSGSNIDIWWLCAAGGLSLIYGIRSILWHQFLDKENDMQSGIRTFAANIEPVSFKKWSRTIIVVEWTSANGSTFPFAFMVTGCIPAYLCCGYLVEIKIVSFPYYCRYNAKGWLFSTIDAGLLFFILSCLPVNILYL